MKKTLKIVAGAVALLLIAALLYLVFGFYGNPLSKALAKNSAESYVKLTYPQLALRHTETVYSFKTGEYEARFVSDKSPDTHFSVYVGGLGQVKKDDHKWRVEGRWNTLERLNTEYQALVEPLLREKLPQQYEMVLAGLGLKGPGEILSRLQLDMEYNPRTNALPGMVSVYLYVQPEEMTWATLAKRLSEADALLGKEGIRPAFYTYVLVPVANQAKPGADPARLGVHELPRQTLEAGGDLAAALEAHAKQWEAQMGAEKDKELQAPASK